MKAVLRALGLAGGLYAAGRRLLAAERYQTAELYLQAAYKLAPARIDIGLALATCLQCRHCPVPAMAVLEQVLAQAPDNTEAQQRLGHAATDAEDWPKAIAQFQQLLRRQPASPEYHYHLGNAYLGAGELQQAVSEFQAALAIEEVASTHNGLGLAYGELAQQAQSIHHFRRAAALSDKPAHLSNLLFTLCYDPDLAPAALFAEHRTQAARLGAPMQRRWPQHFDPARRLRIGYLSPDLRFHPVAFFIEPVLAAHDRCQVEVFAYSTQRHRHSETSLRLQALADHWREFDDPEADEVAEAVLADRIDILVDLAGHTANNSLPLLARRLAPVQASWLGYLNTTGLASMDYRITDVVASPPAFAEPLHSEQLAYLPDSQWCYQPPAEAPDVAASPSLSRPQLTFGALHNPAKVGPAVIALWAEVLRAVPDSRLLIAARGFARIADGTRAQFAALGVSAERIEIRDRLPFAEYLALHAEIDINLDAFPYTGGTTSCHSLWMGVPVLSLAVPTVIGRGGASILTAMGMTDWLARTPEEFVAIAQQKAADREGLAQLRRGLRQRMQVSPLRQADRFTRALEQLYRTMWQQRCAEAAN